MRSRNGGPGWARPRPAHQLCRETNNYPAAFQRLFDACTADEACNASYPDSEGTLANIVADFKANPKTVEAPLPDGTTGTFTLNGNAVLDFIYGMIGQGYTFVALVPEHDRRAGRRPLLRTTCLP